jgi:ComF family protein
VADRVVNIKGLLGRAADGIARVLFPPVCGGCRRHVSEPGTLCGVCWSELRFIEEPWCAVLGTPFDHDHGDGAISPAALADPPPFSRARSAVAYDGVARRMVQDLKFRGRTELAPWMAGWMARAGRELVADAGVLVAVPLHGRRFFSRGFNQSAELARALSHRCGIAFEPGLVRRRRNTRQQIGLKPNERQDNVRGAFEVPERFAAEVKGARVLIVDDVYTTGATVAAVSRALARRGAARVDVLTFARALPGGFAGRGGDHI